MNDNAKAAQLDEVARAYIQKTGKRVLIPAAFFNLLATLGCNMSLYREARPKPRVVH